MKFEEMIGQEYNFYGVDSQMFKLGRFVFEAIEDESDGLRSYLQSVEVKDRQAGIFLTRPIAKVRIEESDEEAFSGWVLRDIETDHVWLKVGTDYCDDYYPFFVFEYQPKKG